MPEGRSHLLHVVLSVVGVRAGLLGSGGATRVVALGRTTFGASANADGAVEAGAEARRAGEDSAGANVAADSGGVGDEGAILSLAGRGAASARVDRDGSVDALVCKREARVSSKFGGAEGQRISLLTTSSAEHDTRVLVPGLGEVVRSSGLEGAVR